MNAKIQTLIISMSVVCLIDDDESDDDKEMLAMVAAAALPCVLISSCRQRRSPVPPSLMSCTMTPSCEALTAVPSLSLRRLLASVMQCSCGRVTFLESNDTF